MKTLNEKLISVYHLDQTREFYLNTGENSLYVPFEALRQNDFSIIENRMKSYFSSYYDTEEKKPFLEKALSALNTPIAIWLKAQLTLLKNNVGM